MVTTKINNIILPFNPQKRKVAAYARVSLETEQLLHSLSAQVSHYRSFIQSNPEWEYVGVYADEGITGTSTRKREAFKRMLADCEAGKVDLILTKSISRFARDTVDCLKTVRHLKELGIEVQFEREHISTFSTDGELLLTLLASFAQAESDSISANVKWAIRKKFQAGIPNGTKAPYGYKWDGEMFRIIPGQGEVVRYIYEHYLTGDSAYKIAKDLKQSGITGQQNTPMTDSTVKNILSNASYTGTMILQKSFTADGHKRRTNIGQLQSYALDGIFEPLVTADEFNQVQEMRQQRAYEQANKNVELTRFSGLVKCGSCGHSCSRRTRDKKKVWVCNTRERKGLGTCSTRPLNETELLEAAETILPRVSDEEFRNRVTRIWVYDDRIEFRLTNGNAKTVQRKYDGSRGHNPFTNKVYCEACGCKCERDNSTKGTDLKVWKCTSCRGHGFKEPELIRACESTFGNAYAGQVVAQVQQITIHKEKLVFHTKDGKETVWDIS